MSLKTEIDRTNSNKEKIKKVATQIDNKLVELGGEQATSLSDVPNKMGVMVRGNYTKFAKYTGELFGSGKLSALKKGENIIEIPLELDFTPNVYTYRIYIKSSEANKSDSAYFSFNSDLRDGAGSIYIYRGTSRDRYAAISSVKAKFVNKKIQFSFKFEGSYNDDNIQYSIGDVTVVQTPQK